MANVQKSNNFYEKNMMNSIEESLSTLGEQTKNIIYKYLEKKHCIEKNQIPSNVEVFVNALESILGNGAKFLEFIIMKRFNEKIGNIIEFEYGEIGDYMKVATEFSKRIIELVELEKKGQLLSFDDK